MTDHVERLERELHGGPSPALAPERLGAIRAAGRRRRTRRRATVVGGAALAVVLAVGTPFLLPDGDPSGTAPAGPAPVERSGATRGADPAEPEIRPDPDLPRDLLALQERVLAEIPGAVRSSPTQVDLPDPRAADPDLLPRSSGYPRSDGPSIGLGVPNWTDPQNFPPEAWPAWLLSDWIAFRNRAARSDDPALRRLSAGLRASGGDVRMGCEARNPARTCRPVLLARSGVTTRLTDTFRRVPNWLGDRGPDDVYVAGPATYSPGDAPSLVVAGVARDDVSSVEFVSSTGETVEGRVDADLAPGTTIMWAAVPGDVERVLVDGEEP